MNAVTSAVRKVLTNEFGYCTVLLLLLLLLLLFMKWLMTAPENGCVEDSLFVVQGPVYGSLCTKRLVDKKSEEARVLEKRE
jgi:hypothetical protein